MTKTKQFRIFVWREDGWEEGDPLLWRAQVYNEKNIVTSLIGVGPTREAALADCLRRFVPPEREGDWLTIAEAREIVSESAQ